MSKKKKIIISVLVVFILIFVVTWIYIETPRSVYKESYDNFEIFIRTSDSGFFDLGLMGDREYIISLYEKNGIFPVEIYHREILFSNDGSKIGEENIDITWENENAIIELHSDEMHRKYVVYYD